MFEFTSNRFLYCRISFRVNRARCLVQHQNRAVLDEGAAQSHELPLTATRDMRLTMSA